MCFSVCGPGDGGENPAFRNIPVRLRESLSGRSWTAWDHKDTQTERERVKEPRSPALNTKTHREKNPVHLLLLGGNTIRTWLRTETFNGAIVSGTWPDPDPFYITKLLEVCQSHMHTHTNGDGQPWCYSGAYFYPCCSWDWLLGWLAKPTDQVMSYRNLAAPLQSRPCIYTHTHPDTLESMHF